eukprot:scaffold505_cov45-Phaeocystis_antarctica.AAC.1
MRVPRAVRALEAGAWRRVPRRGCDRARPAAIGRPPRRPAQPSSSGAAPRLQRTLCLLKLPGPWCPLPVQPHLHAAVTLQQSVAYSAKGERGVRSLVGGLRRVVRPDPRVNLRRVAESGVRREAGGENAGGWKGGAARVARRGRPRRCAREGARAPARAVGTWREPGTPGRSPPTGTSWGPPRRRALRRTPTRPPRWGRPRRTPGRRSPRAAWGPWCAVPRAAA